MSLMQGTTLWYATAGTSWTAVAAGAAPGSPWVQITRVNNFRLTPHETDKYDLAPLEATARDMQRDLTPGNCQFQMEEQATLSKTIRDLIDAGTKKAFAVVFKDGTAEYSASGLLHATTGSEGQKGDFHARVPESYQFDADGVFTRQAAA
jgi:hypothetical protein